MDPSTIWRVVPAPRAEGIGSPYRDSGLSALLNFDNFALLYAMKKATMGRHKVVLLQSALRDHIGLNGRSPALQKRNEP